MHVDLTANAQQHSQLLLVDVCGEIAKSAGRSGHRFGIPGEGGARGVLHHLLAPLDRDGLEQVVRELEQSPHRALRTLVETTNRAIAICHTHVRHTHTSHQDAIGAYRAKRVLGCQRRERPPPAHPLGHAARSLGTATASQTRSA